MLIIFLINLFMGFIALLNIITIDKLPRTGKVSERTSIILPMRNEARNAKRILENLKQFLIDPNLELIIVDDQSTDETLLLLAGVIENWPKELSVSLISGAARPAGWIGKSWANWQGASRALDSKYLIFIDADIFLSQNAFAGAIAYLKAKEIDLLSPYPKQISLTWSEKFFQPLLHWSWLTTLYLKQANSSLRPSQVVANGQFLAMKAETYFSLGGHEAIKDEVLDDLALGKLFRRGNAKTSLIDGGAAISCRMYQSFTELKNGYRKSLWSAFGSIWSATLVALFYFAIGILPLVGAFLHWQFSIAALLAAIITRYLSAIAFEESLISPLFHPFAIAFFLYLLKTSWILKYLGRLNWKGRPL